MGGGGGSRLSVRLRIKGGHGGAKMSNFLRTNEMDDPMSARPTSVDENTRYENYVVKNLSPRERDYIHKFISSAT